MVGATTTFCRAASRTRFLRYSAMRKSLLSWRWRPCSLDSAPRAITTTVSRVRMYSASSHERVSRRTAAFGCADCGADAAGACVCAEVITTATPSEKERETSHRRAGFIWMLKCFIPLIRRTSNLVCELLCDSPGFDSAVEVVHRADGAHETGLAREAEKFTETIDAFDSCAVRTKNAGGVVFLELGSSPGELLVVRGEEMEATDGGVDRSRAEKAACVFERVDDSRVS